MAAGRRLEGRIALVTGASRGIGAAVAKRFAAEGARLVLVARSPGALEEIDDAVRAAAGTEEGATLVPLDVTDAPALDRLGAAIHERFGKLDVLVGNAAILGTLTPVGHIEPAEWDEVIATNLTANWRLIRSLDPLLQLSDAGRAIFLSSGVARTVFPYWGTYAVSKAALEMLVKIYAAENDKTNVNANLLDPATVRTAMRAAAMPGEDPMTLPEPDAITDDFVALAEPACTRNGEVVRLS